MKLTGKCKDDFEKWVEKQKFSILHDVGERQMNIVPLGDMFEQLHDSMQYGVMVDFFDSVGIEIEITRDIDWEDKVILGWVYYIENYENNKWYDSRQEAREQAITKANEIYNSKL